jgi:hypothetical protein
MVKCEICGREFNTLGCLGSHVSRGHKIKPEEYYLTYINPIKGKCKICGKDTRFTQMKDGYQIYCSTKCLAKDPDVKIQKEKTRIKKHGIIFKIIGEFKCEICGKDLKTFVGISNHIAVHKIKPEEYYLTYINPIKGKCKICGKDTRFTGIKTGYLNYCSPKCSSNDPDVKIQKEKTYYEKTGYKHHMQNPEVIEKRDEDYYKKTGYKHPSQNPDVINKKEETSLKNNGCKNPSQNPEISKKSGESNKIKFPEILKRYPELVIIENLIEGLNGEILGHCKNADCPNSAEKGGRFILTAWQLYIRNHGINSTSDFGYFYCCEECKGGCIAYKKSAKQLYNIFNPQDELSKISPSDLSAWRNEVFTRQLLENKEHNSNYCEICHKTENLVGHHILPQKLYPESALDPDNGVILCSECHNKYGHTKGTECSTGNLANIICK